MKVFLRDMYIVPTMGVTNPIAFRKTHTRAGHIYSRVHELKKYKDNTTAANQAKTVS